ARLRAESAPAGETPRPALRGHRAHRWPHVRSGRGWVDGGRDEEHRGSRDRPAARCRTGARSYRPAGRADVPGSARGARPLPAPVVVAPMSLHPVIPWPLVIVVGLVLVGFTTWRLVADSRRRGRWI